MKNCELCSSVARLVCESDEASLCFECDAKVHGANFLVARHQRLLLCRRCQSPTPWRADGPRLGPTVSLCRRCLLHKSQRDDDEGEEEDQDDDDGDEEEEEEGEEQVVPWASDEEEKDTPLPPVASSSSSDEETAPAAAATTARERNGLLKRTMRENTVDLPTSPSPCSSFSRDGLSDQPRQPVQTGSGCNMDDEATSGSYRPSKSRTLLRSAPLRSATADLVVSGPPRRAPI